MIKRWLIGFATSTAKRDLEQYLLALDGGSDGERGHLLVVAHEARLECEEQYGFPTECFLDPIQVDNKVLAQFGFALGQLHDKYQEQKSERIASGLVIWIHSTRAAMHPTLRTDGRRLWGMLSRGFTAATLIANAAPGRPARLASEIDAIPTGLEPRDALGNELNIGKAGRAIVERRRVELDRQAYELEIMQEQKRKETLGARHLEFGGRLDDALARYRGAKEDI